MSVKNNLVGQTFNRLTVIADGGRDKRQNVLWLCRCECGNTTKQFAYDLRSGKVESCGCIRKSGDRNVIHGFARKRHRRSKVYSVWAAMIQRCSNPNDANYHHYGGRGIQVCTRWRTFENFASDMGIPPRGGTLERVNNDIGYRPDNCVWATRSTQSRNKRSNVWVTIDGVTKIQQDWVEEFGVSPAHVHYYMQKGMSREEAIKRNAS